MKTSDEIRETFLTYFEERDHQRIKSASLVPKNDPTLLFTNAGMNQFKEVFLGRDHRDYRRAASSQKCMRVSGKHNDLETVGRTPRHHTFFEMLGNFSFGDYFKVEAIEFAWELCTEVYGLDKDRLIITVFEEDEEAYGIWKDRIGVPERLLYRCGAKENFWAMGETGPCGPCSELHYDMGERIGDRTSSFEEETDRFVEIWNLVFMQYNRDASGEMTPLPSPSIDTGMGLERIACVLQGVKSNYETDLFKPIIEEASRLTSTPYGQEAESDVSLRILADHSRAAMFLINDGIVPGNEGRGYVLRKILRRAIRHGKMLGTEEPFVFTLTALAGELMGSAYPELTKSREYAAEVVKNEEEKFSATLSHGLNLLEKAFDRVKELDGTEIPGGELFKLYDTYGFPFDLAREIAEEKGYHVDEKGFQEELEQQRKRARASWKAGETKVNPTYQRLARRGLTTEFTGYDDIDEVKGKVLAILNEGEEVERLGEGETGEIVLDRTPFYAEAGGQVADEGTIEHDNLQAEVEDVFVPSTGLRLHRIKVLHGALRIGERVSSTVLRDPRSDTMKNHTATHLMHAALREVLGEHVKQAGSLVAPDRLRFDFTHFKPLTSWELEEIEQKVNEKIRSNIQVRTRIKDLDEAVRDGATALFGEKYSSRVRVVEVPGVSQELCGGTHVDRTGDISLFKITSESSISAGVRRLEAITGSKALERFLNGETQIRTIASELQVSRDQLVESVSKLNQELKDRNREIEKLRLEIAQQQSGDPLDSAREVGGVKVLSQMVDNVDRSGLRQLADRLKNKLVSGVVVLGTSNDGKVSLVVMVTDDLTARIKADDLIRPIAGIVGGGGGGKPDLAEAGGKNVEALGKALEEAYNLVEASLNRSASSA